MWQNCCVLVKWKSWDSAVCLVSRLRTVWPTKHGSIAGRAECFFLFVKSSDPVVGLTQPVCCSVQGMKCPRRAWDDSSSSSARLRRTGVYDNLPIPPRLHGLHIDSSHLDKFGIFLYNTGRKLFTFIHQWCALRTWFLSQEKYFCYAGNEEKYSDKCALRAL
jgi:hypothetical protein